LDAVLNPVVAYRWITLLLMRNHFNVYSHWDSLLLIGTLF
jgi:hypothetical protein